MGQLEPEIGGGDFDTGETYENEAARRASIVSQRLGGAWNKLQRTILRELPDATRRTHDATLRIGRRR